MSPDAKSQRLHPRRRLAVDLSQHLVRAEGRQAIKCLAVDVSRNGLGVVCFEELTPQTDVILMLKSKGITLRVVWCKPDGVREGIFHVGLNTNDLAINVERSLEAEGLATAAPVEPITFDSVRDALANAHMPDATVFRSAKLSKLAQFYCSFPLNHRGVSLFVLLPKDLRPAEASKLDEAEAISRKLIILLAEGGDWKKIWPRETP